MKWLLGVLVFMAGVSIVEAQPGVYRVVDVGASDVLNIRAAADARSEILGGLAPDAVMVEVLEQDEGWGRIVFEEENGWVNLGFLSPMERQTAGEFNAPGQFQCMGTEPFWGAEIGRDGGFRFYDAMSMGEDLSADLTSAETASARPEPYHYRFDGEISGSLTIAAQTCSDGMSDRDYGWRVYLFAYDRENGRRFVDGCCMTPLSE